MSVVNWDYIDTVIYINLKKRKDRRVRITRQLKKIGIPKEKIVRIEAIEYHPGHIGCTKSHILALETAKAHGWQNVLILEDDFEFNHDDDTRNRINNYFKALSSIKWDVAFLAANHYFVTPLKSVDYLVKVNKAWCACAYIVNHSYYDTLIDNYILSLNALLQGGEKQQFALDVHWQWLMLRDRWLGIFPNAGLQAADRSDIEQCDVNYKLLFEKPLSTIAFQDVPHHQRRIKVDFYFQWTPGWTNFESVIAAFQRDQQFDCQIVVIPYLNRGAKDVNGQAQRDLLDKKGIEYVAFEDYSLTARSPDVVFLQNPYDEARPPLVQCENLLRHGIQIAYIPYGLDMGAGERNTVYQYNRSCHLSARWIFVRSDRHKLEYGRLCAAGNEHVYVTGHPKFDHYKERYQHTLKPDDNAKTTVLWTPYFVVPSEEGMTFSTFNVYVHTMLSVVAQYDINLIIRPHPVFRQFIDSLPDSDLKRKTQKNFAALMAASQQNRRITWDFDSDYTSAFSRSDALMGDAGSFLLEYLPSHKPILYLTHSTCLGINRSADFIYQAYDIARCEQDIFNFIDNVVNNRDPNKDKRLKVLEQELYIPPRGAGEEIVTLIKRSFPSYTGAERVS